MSKGKYKGEQITWRCSAILKQQITDSAKKQGISLTDWMRRAAEDCLNKEAISGCGVSEPMSVYVSSKETAWLIQALKTPAVKKEIKYIVSQILDEEE